MDPLTISYVWLSLSKPSRYRSAATLQTAAAGDNVLAAAIFLLRLIVEVVLVPVDRNALVPKAVLVMSILLVTANYCTDGKKVHRAALVVPSRLLQYSVTHDYPSSGSLVLSPWLAFALMATMRTTKISTAVYIVMTLPAVVD